MEHVLSYIFYQLIQISNFFEVFDKWSSLGEIKSEMISPRGPQKH